MIMHGLLHHLEHYIPQPDDLLPARHDVHVEDRSEIILRDIGRMYEEQAEAARAGLIGGALAEALAPELEAEVTRSWATEQTRRGYKTDWAAFRRFCTDQGLRAKPASNAIIAYFLYERLALHGNTASRLSRYLQAIAFVHRTAHLPLEADDSLIRAVLARARRFRKEVLDTATEIAVKRSAANGTSQPEPEGTNNG